MLELESGSFVWALGIKAFVGLLLVHVFCCSVAANTVCVGQLIAGHAILEFRVGVSGLAKESINTWPEIVAMNLDADSTLRSL
jgi:hypothetical protein